MGSISTETCKTHTKYKTNNAHLASSHGVRVICIQLLREAYRVPKPIALFLDLCNLALYGTVRRLLLPWV